MRVKALVLLCLSVLLSVFYFSEKISNKIYEEKSDHIFSWWLDSINIYLSTGELLLMSYETNRPLKNQIDEKLVYKHKYVPLEEVWPGDDQGYPLILSIFGRFLGMKEASDIFSIQFNYLVHVLLGLLSTLLLFFAFRSMLISVAFFYLYLYGIHIYEGYLDHHWLIGDDIYIYI